jgi:hypothetical protein
LGRIIFKGELRVKDVPLAKYARLRFTCYLHVYHGKSPIAKVVISKVYRHIGNFWPIDKPLLTYAPRRCTKVDPKTFNISLVAGVFSLDSMQKKYTCN